MFKAVKFFAVVLVAALFMAAFAACGAGTAQNCAGGGTGAENGQANGGTENDDTENGGSEDGNNQDGNTQDGGEAAEEIMLITVNDNIFIVDLEDNASSRALLERLQSGDITLTMNDYGNMEKVGELGFSLPRSDRQITVAPGDVILYLGDQLTIYYDTNSWNFTRLGHIRGVNSREFMLELLGGEGQITVTLSAA